jgi:ABC-2 type transport system permease protein
MLRGASFTSLWVSFVVLAIYAVVVFSMAVLRLRRDLAPSVKEHTRRELPAETVVAG